MEYNTYIFVPRGGIDVAGVPEICSGMVFRDNRQKHLKNNYSMLQMMYDGAKRKADTSWSIVIMCSAFKRNQFPIICLVLDYVNIVISNLNMVLFN